MLHGLLIGPSVLVSDRSQHKTQDQQARHQALEGGHKDALIPAGGLELDRQEIWTHGWFRFWRGRAETLGQQAGEASQGGRLQSAEAALAEIGLSGFLLATGAQAHLMRVLGRIGSSCLGRQPDGQRGGLSTGAAL